MSKSLLVLSVNKVVPADVLDKLRDHVQSFAKSIGCDGFVSPAGCEVSVHHDLEPVVKAMQENTAAVRQLAEACAMLIDAMAEADDEEGLPGSYLDGSPVSGLDAG